MPQKLKNNNIKKNSGKAITSFILGISSLVLAWLPIIGWIVIITGIVFGILALKDINKNPKLGGKIFAIIGIALCCIFFLIPFVLGFVSALAYFGVLSPDKFLPHHCTMEQNSNFVCLDFKATSDDEIFLILRNKGNNQIEDFSVLFEGMGGVQCSDGNIYSLKENEQVTIRLNCQTELGEIIKGNFTISGPGINELGKIYGKKEIN